MTRSLILLIVPVLMLAYSVLFILGEVLARILDVMDDTRAWLRKQISAATRSSM